MIKMCGPGKEALFFYCENANEMFNAKPNIFQKWKTFVVFYIVVWYMYAVFDAHHNATAGAFGSGRTKLEQNRFGNGAELVFLGLHIDTGAT